MSLHDRDRDCSEPSPHQTCPLSNPPSHLFKHNALYQFWLRSEGFWFSKVVKVAVRFLKSHELLAIHQIHQKMNLNIEFGVRMQWEYYTKAESGKMGWYVSANHPNLIFSDRILSQGMPQILHYQMVTPSQFVTTIHDLEETIYLQTDYRRLRELRRGDHLLRQRWEQKLNP